MYRIPEKIKMYRKLPVEFTDESGELHSVSDYELEAYPVDPEDIYHVPALAWAGVDLTKTKDQRWPCQIEEVENHFDELQIMGTYESVNFNSVFLVDLMQNNNTYRVKLELGEVLELINLGLIEKEGHVKGEFVFMKTKFSNGEVTLVRVGSWKYKRWVNDYVQQEVD